MAPAPAAAARSAGSAATTRPRPCSPPADLPTRYGRHTPPLGGTTSVHVVAVITAKPGSEDVVRDALTALVAPTRAEAGCLAYDLSESAASPGTFVTVEEWNDPSDLDTHLASDHVQAALAATGDALTQPPAIHPLSPVVVG